MQPTVETLKDHLRDLIAMSGPISVAEYMSLALAHPTLGYYHTRDPLGRSGDFTTAPEISQMFGELLGLWAASTWERLGKPEVFRLIEVGPGRGTLMVDALRATRNVSGFQQALQIHLVETSPVLIMLQREVLKDFDSVLHWHQNIHEIPVTDPVCMLGNEFLDALPVRQVIFQDGLWFERLVNWHDGELVFETSPVPLSPQPEIPSHVVTDSVVQDSVFEIPVGVDSVLQDIYALLKQAGGAALFIDYGHTRSGIGDTLQAVKGHKYASVFAEPGQADLTVHVDFEYVSRSAQKEELAVYGPISQGTFLSNLGIGMRAQQLMKSARTGGQRHDVVSAYERLVNVQEMGALFKVIAITSSDFGFPEGFQSIEAV